MVAALRSSALLLICSSNHPLPFLPPSLPSLKTCRPGTRQGKLARGRSIVKMNLSAYEVFAGAAMEHLLLAATVHPKLIRSEHGDQALTIHAVAARIQYALLCV